MDHLLRGGALSKEFDEVLQRWKVNSKVDLHSAFLTKEKDLEAWKVTPGMKYPVEWDQPPFLIPSGEKNAKNINDILKKSWEIQAGSNPNLPDGFGEYPTLVTNSCFQIHGFLKYYFNCLGIIQISKFDNTGFQILVGILLFVENS